MILVTGGTGFLGSHLIYHLLKVNDRIRALRRPDSELSVLSSVFAFYGAGFTEMNNRIEWVEGDVTNVHSLDPCFEGVSKVYHVAGKVSFHSSERDQLQRTNAEGTANVVNLALDRNIEKLLYVSSVAAIGRGGNEKIISEEVVWKTSHMNSRYAISKYAAEREVWRGIAEGLNAVIVNPSVVLGAGDVNGSYRLIKSVERGLKFYTTGVNGFVDVRDVAQIMIRLMESDVPGERFIVSSENLAYRTLFEYIAEGLGKPGPGYPAGKFISELTWRGALLKSWISGRPPFITKEIARTANNIHHYSSEKLIRTLGCKFIPIRETILEMCRFYREANIEDGQQDRKNL
jgi:dihydroflavonol-4-reductase